MTFLASASFEDLGGFPAQAVSARPLRRIAVAGLLAFAAVAAAVGGIAALASAWMIAASLLATPHDVTPRPIALRAPADLAPSPRVAANPYGRLPSALSWLRPAEAPAPAAHRETIAPQAVARPPSPEAAAPAPRARLTPDFSKVVPNVPPPPLRPRDLAPASGRGQPGDLDQTPPLPPRHPAEAAPSRLVEAPPVRPLVPARRPAGRPAPETAAPVPPPAMPDTRNPLQRFFDALTQAGDGASASRPSGPLPPGAVGLPAPGSHIAVYDISAHTVYLPDGERLEAHSGLGPMLDDPRSSRVKDRGVTPPHLYDLTMREQLFHGVAAIRLTPVGAGEMYGRVGLLAHTYMLGPNGQSNGCVSFRNYGRFLRAFQRGEINRMVVVARLGDALPGSAGRRWRYASN